MEKVLGFLKNWTLPISMISGALSYVIYINIPQLTPTRAFAAEFISYLQPTLIFCMLFVTFCKVSPKDLKLTRWHLGLAVLQSLSFAILGTSLIAFPENDARVLIESTMICMICPTATAAAVVTSKLGGNAATLTTYTIISNAIVAVIVPALTPLVHPSEGMSFLPTFFLIMSKIFPMLICPLFLAWAVRLTMPGIHRSIVKLKDAAFYLWAVSLAIAIAVTVKAIHHSNVSIWEEVGIAIISLITCIIQFVIGKALGEKYGERINGGQALGQKNTVFAIWMGYTFFSPVTAMAGGFYSVWHNVVNSYQLYKKRKQEEPLS